MYSLEPWPNFRSIGFCVVVFFQSDIWSFVFSDTWDFLGLQGKIKINREIKTKQTPPAFRFWEKGEQHTRAKLQDLFDKNGVEIWAFCMKNCTGMNLRYRLEIS